MIYYIFRHGETYFSKNSLPYEDQITTAGILPERIPVVKRLGKYLKESGFDIHYSSPINRCIQTSEIIESVTGKDFIVDERLGEYRDDIGETFDQLRARVQAFINDISRQQVKSAAICTHGGCMSAFKHLLLYNKYEWKDLMDYPKTGVIWIIKHKTLKEINFN